MMEGDMLMEEVEMLPRTMEEPFIRKTERPAFWGDKDLNPQAKDRVKKTVEEMVPEQFHKYLKVFLKKESEWMPLWKEWDHTIQWLKKLSQCLHHLQYPLVLQTARLGAVSR
jgi:hypothetical protein